MEIVRLSVFRPVMISMVLLFFSALGFYYYSQLVVNLFPTISQPSVVITTIDENEPSVEVESNITDKIEKELTGISGLKRVYSLSREGSSQVYVEYNRGYNMDNAMVDISEKMNIIKDDLPDSSEEPIVERFNPTDEPVVILTFPLTVMVKEKSIATFPTVESSLIPLLERINGVSKVAQYGNYEELVLIKVDRFKLESHKLDIATIVSAVNSGNVNDVVGSIEGGDEKILVQIKERYRSLSEIGRIPVVNDSQRTLYLSEIATISLAHSEPEKRFRVNGEAAGALYIYKGDDGNLVEIAHEIDKVVKTFHASQKTLPDETVRASYNQDEYVATAVESLKSSIFFSILLTAIILFVFLWNARAVAVALIAIPLSIVVSFIFFYFFSLTINLFSLTGITLAVGMIVDSVIVVLENVSKHCEMGKNVNQAVISGVTEVSSSILASTLTTIIVFFPLFYLDGIIGDVFTELCLSISFVILISFFVSITCMPLLGRFVFKQKSAGEGNNLLNKIEKKVIDKYISTLDLMLQGSSRKRWGFMGGIFLLFVFVLIIAPSYQPFPTVPQQELGLEMTFPPNTREEVMVREIEGFEQSLKKSEAHQYIKTMGISFSKERIEVLIKLHTPDSYYLVKEQLQKRLEQIAGVEYFFKDITPLAKVIGAKKFDTDLEFVRLTKKDSERIFEQIDKLINRLEKEGVLEVAGSSIRTTEVYFMEIDRDKLNQLKISVQEVVEQLKSSYIGEDLEDFVSSSGTISMRINANGGDEQNMNDISGVSVITSNGSRVPVKSFAKIIKGVTPSSVMHDERNIVDHIYLVDKTPEKELNNILQDSIGGFNLGTGQMINLKGNNENAEGMEKKLPLLALVSCILVFMLLAGLFESLKQPMIILLTIPLSLIGAIMGLLLFGEPLTISAGLGVILLIGIAVNNGILLVEFTNIFRQRGMRLIDAIKEASASRVKPILMTSMTTFIGMIPLILSVGNGAELYRPLSQVVVTGLVFSTFFTIYFIPISYYLLEEAKEKSYRFILDKQST